MPCFLSSYSCIWPALHSVDVDPCYPLTIPVDKGNVESGKEIESAVILSCYQHSFQFVCSSLKCYGTEKLNTRQHKNKSWRELTIFERAHVCKLSPLQRLFVILTRLHERRYEASRAWQGKKIQSIPMCTRFGFLVFPLQFIRFLSSFFLKAHHICSFSPDANSVLSRYLLLLRKQAHME